MNKFINKYKPWLLVALVIVVAGGVWLATKSDNTTTKTSVNKELQDKCKTEVNDDTFCKFVGSFGNAGDYKVSVNSTAPEGTSVLELANDSQGNSSMVAKQNGQEQANIIVFSSTTYSKDYSDGKWFKYSSSDSSKPTTLDLKKEFAKGDFKGDNGQKLEYKKITTEKCGKLSCYKYQIVDPQKTSQEGFIWFDTKDYLLRRVTVKEGTTNADMSLSYSSVSISAPSPTKDDPSADSLSQ
ncbi:hypothetical protein HYW35_02905 [Candidatus Saccharibacteria bacterium]|nr:hypothetical protein [Candidatus Saccharibacteria bacterium]